jgi:hypothetical protein
MGTTITGEDIQAEAQELLKKIDAEFDGKGLAAKRSTR